MAEDRHGDPLDVGRKTRKIPPALRRAVTLRDRGCVFPGCTHDRFVDCHHIEHWADGGATSKDNLLLLCTFHHRVVHEGGFAITRDARGGPVFRNPEGARLPSVHRPVSDLRGPELLEALIAEQLELGLHDETAYPLWDGRAPEYAACVAHVVLPPDTRHDATRPLSR